MNKTPVFKSVLSPESIIKHYDSFLAFIPEVAKFLKVKNFVAEMGFTMPQYYRRLDNPDLWTRNEIEKFVKLLGSLDIPIILTSSSCSNRKDIEPFKGTTAKELKFMMQRVGMSSKMLSEGTGIATSNISHYLSGKKNLSNIAQIGLYYFLKHHGA